MLQFKITKMQHIILNKNIGHMGKKSGVEELPEVIKMIYNQV